MRSALHLVFGVNMTPKSRALRWVTFLLVVLAVGYAGMRLGRALRGRAAPAIIEAPPFPFRPGDPLPDVQLADSTGTASTSLGLVAERGGAVVLFLDPNCEGCLAMAQRWERALADGVVEPGRVLGVTREPAEVNARYRTEHGLSFPIYQDVESAYLQRHGVVTYPMEVVVGASGTILSLSDDSKSPIDGDAIRSLLSQ